MPIDYNSDGVLVYKASQTDRNRIRKALDICEAIATFGLDEERKGIGRVGHDFLLSVKEIIEPKKSSDKPAEKEPAEETAE